jgi:hypothetical protein
MFYLLKNFLLLILTIFKLKCNNLIFNEVMVWMLCMCVCMYSRFVENHPIRILEDGPLISEVVLSHTRHRCGGGAATEPSRGSAWAWTRNTTTWSRSHLGWMRPPGDAGGGTSLAARISGDAGGGGSLVMRATKDPYPSRGCRWMGEVGQWVVTADKYSCSCSHGGTHVGPSRLRLLAWGTRVGPTRQKGGVCVGTTQDEPSL